MLLAIIVPTSNLKIPVVDNFLDFLKKILLEMSDNSIVYIDFHLCCLKLSLSHAEE